MSSWASLLSQAWRFDRSRGLTAEMELLDRNLPAAFVTYTLVAVMATWAYWSTIGDASVLWWGLASTLLGIACFLGRKVLPSPGDPAKVLVYAQAVRFMAMLLGVTWGLFALLFMKPEWPITLTLVITMLAGMSAGGLVVFSSSWPVSVAYGLPCLLPSALVLLPARDPVSQSMGLASLAYLLVMGVFSFHAVQVTRRSIHLRFENADLVERLREQTHRAFEARQMAEEALQDAEEANRAKSVFLASASHDLRQPLHALGLFLTALGHTDLDERQRQMWGHVEASSAAASEMLNTLLDFSKVDAGVITPQPQAFPVQSLLHKLERHFAPQANDKGLVFRVRDTDLVVWADPRLVEQVLRNLLTNAIRYTERGGVLLGCRRRGDQAVLEVWDTGIGIEPSQHQAIFQEFHQLGNPERDRTKGLGLGLAIVQGLAQAMGTTVALLSRPGRGSVFRMTLSLSQEGVPEEAVAPAVSAPLVGVRVLLIDDDEAVRMAMAELLTAWGCACEPAGSEAEAVRLLARFTPDVVLADFRLRDHRTGPQAIEAVRARVGRAVPAIIVTGDTAADRLRTAVGSGITLLHKPVGSVALQRALARALALASTPPGSDQVDAPSA
ncbi:hybrid sensor histidine kinase/response regulator [Aquabacterium sp. CECT 9606]|uniref:hybrid sensor histidine kinase/response regulator n=1 Tax=Aquabacterium sp. CECT 9606 TaxID=2845822 RepID=UPI001E3592F3|nr:hybrid sensor histidine kinase/response regulator [Aquabacterium sp. CECT 9606]CAH0356166.1 Sensor histidine kinase RcsC [Aquabacterium sp. CECT 9606]